MANPNAQILISAGLSKSMAYHVVNGVRSVSVPLALWLFERDGIKVGPLADKTSREIETLRKLYVPAAPESVLQRRKEAA